VQSEEIDVTTKPTYDAPYLRTDAGTLAGALVVRPSASVAQLPPIHGESSPIAERALEAHTILVRTLRDRGTHVVELDATSGAAAESFVADCAVIVPGGAILMRPSKPERRAEVATVETALRTLGIPIVGRIESPGLLDGADVAYVGVIRSGSVFGSRSNQLGRKQFESLCAAAGYRSIELALTHDVARLRNVFSIVGESLAIAAPDHVDVVPAGSLTIVAVPRGEQFAAGVLAVGDRRVLANLRFRESIKTMKDAKISVEAIDLWEFGKAGAGPFSLVLPFKRT